MKNYLSDPNWEEVGARLHFYIKKHKRAKMKDVSERLGIAPNHISLVCKGKRRATLSLLVSVVKMLDIDKWEQEMYLAWIVEGALK